MSGCGSHPAGGDPGGKRLKELAHDGVFASLPAQATKVSREEQKAVYTKPGFTGGGWRGPSVVVTFRSDAPPDDVYRFYAARADAAGWAAGASGSTGHTDRWSKTFPDGAAATLVLTSAGGTYRLAGAIAPKTS